MKTIPAHLSLVLVALLSGCTHTTYTDPSGAKFSRTSFLNSQSVGRVEMRAGDKLLTMEGYASEQSQAAAAVVTAAVRAAVKP
jgi:hypothetical protein